MLTSEDQQDPGEIRAANKIAYANGLYQIYGFQWHSNYLIAFMSPIVIG